MDMFHFVIGFVLVANQGHLAGLEDLHKEHPTVRESFCTWHQGALDNNPTEVASIGVEVIERMCGTDQAYDHLLVAQKNGNGAEKYAQGIFAWCTSWWGDASACGTVPAVKWAERTGLPKDELVEKWRENLDKQFALSRRSP